MSASFECRQRGFTLSEFSRYFGKKPDGKSNMCGVDTIKSWYQHKPIIFFTLLDGATDKLLEIKGVCLCCKSTRRVTSLIDGKIIDCPSCSGGILNEKR